MRPRSTPTSSTSPSISWPIMRPAGPRPRPPRGRSCCRVSSRHHGGAGRLGGRGVCGQGPGPGSTEAGEELFAGIGTFVRMARCSVTRRATLPDGKPSFAGPVTRGHRRPPAGPGLPGQRLRPHHLPPDHRRGLDATGVTRESLVAGQAPPTASDQPRPPAPRSCSPPAT